MNTTTTSAARDIRLPPDRFYWGLLDASSLPSRARRTGLVYLFESVLPVSVENVQAVFTPLDANRFLVCAMDRDRLVAHEGALALGPESLPPFLHDPVLHAAPLPDPVSINLLVSDFEPRAFRRARQRATLLACVAILACACIVAVGQLRRTARWRDIAESFAQATTSVYDRVLPPSAGAPVPPAARLTAELRTLDRTRAAAPAGAPRDITPTLAALLARWPADLPASTESLVAAPGAITLTVRLPDEASAERLERELTPPPGWRVTQPSVQRERDALTVRVRMEPVP